MCVFCILIYLDFFLVLCIEIGKWYMWMWDSEDDFFVILFNLGNWYIIFVFLKGWNICEVNYMIIYGFLLVLGWFLVLVLFLFLFLIKFFIKFLLIMFLCGLILMEF